MANASALRNQPTHGVTIRPFMTASVSSLPLLATILAAWLAWAVAAYYLLRRSARPHDAYAGFFMLALRLYARACQPTRITGAEHIPRWSPHLGRPPGPLIIVANHTAGIDPLLIQLACPFEIRWLMAADMMHPALDQLWAWSGVIRVDRDNPRGDASALRLALAHLKSCGVIGIFPEGAIARPIDGRRQVLPFAPGVGLLVRRAKAPVLQVVIQDTAVTPTAWGSLITRATPRLHFLPLKDYTPTKHDAASIADDLEDRLIDHTGWTRPQPVSR